MICKNIPRIFILIALLNACTDMNLSKLDIQGHRGCRGLLPENSIPAFIKAMELGVHTLELDVVISKDHQVVVSHEPWISPEICFIPKDGAGNPVDTNIYHLTYSEILKFDCGSRPHARFPNQEKVRVAKPLLKEVFRVAEHYTDQNNISPVNYNIEIKRRPEFDEVFHPAMQIFADLVLSEINRSGISERVTVQCFDIETLQYLHKKYPETRLVYLIESELDFEKNINALGFTPEIYSPYLKLVNPELMAFAGKQKMKVIPWTVNTVEDMSAMIKLGVNGIISDYPDRLIDLVNSSGNL